MPGVFVVTDSSCDLEQDDIDPFEIEIVPLTIRFGSDRFTDRRDLSVEDFYQRMANSADLPQTACPPPGAFEEAFRRANRRWRRGGASVSPSRASCRPHFRSALTAAAAFQGPVVIHMVDSRTVSSGLGTLVIEAAKAAAVGG